MSDPLIDRRISETRLACALTDVATTGYAPLHPETSPEAIWSRQRRDVELAMQRGITTPPAISRYCCLLVWNVMRAIHEIETGDRFRIKPAKRRTRSKKGTPKLIFN